MKCLINYLCKTRGLNYLNNLAHDKLFLRVPNYLYWTSTKHFPRTDGNICQSRFLKRTYLLSRMFLDSDEIFPIRSEHHLNLNREYLVLQIKHTRRPYFSFLVKAPANHNFDTTKEFNSVYNHLNPFDIYL